MRQRTDVCSVFQCGHLSELDVSDSKLGAAAMRRLCYELRNPRCKLQKLTCRAVTPARALRELVLLLHGNGRLTHLDLSANRLGFALAAAIFRPLRHSACRLQRLWLCACELRAPGGRQLADALLQNRGLTHLSLRRNGLGDEGVRALSSALGRAACSLQSLDLSECAFGKEGCWVLAEALGRNACLKALDVGGNGFGDAGARRLCAALRRPGCVLSTLGLESCRLTSACCPDLASALGVRTSLANLNLLGNDLGPEGVGALWPSLQKPSCQLQRLGLEKDLYRLIEGKLQGLQEKGRFLRILCRWDFNEPEDKWWWW